MVLATSKHSVLRSHKSFLSLNNLLAFRSLRLASWLQLGPSSKAMLGCSNSDRSIARESGSERVPYEESKRTNTDGVSPASLDCKLLKHFRISDPT
jgi:hypothetical protein